MDITKISNFILYALEKEVTLLNDKKLSILLFLTDYEAMAKNGTKIFGEEYIKTPRNPEPKMLTELFEIMANDEELDDEDPRLDLIQELLSFVEIEISQKEKFIELKFHKYEEEFDPSIFTKDEMGIMRDMVKKYKNTTPRNIANQCFKLDKVRETANGEVII